MHRYKAWNGAMPTTAALPAVTTGTVIKTMLQLATPSTRQIQVYGWGFTLDDPPGAEAAPFLTYRYNFPEGEEPIVAVSKFLRVRATTPTTAVDLRCFIIHDE